MSSGSDRQGGDAAPVVIGGVGGSGTRVVADLVSELGWHLGSDLNRAGDHLGFTLLLKRPRWRAARFAARNLAALELLERSLRGLPRLGWGNLRLATSAALCMAPTGYTHLGQGRGVWPFVRAARLFRGGLPEGKSAALWGWKEPNSHFYLDLLASRYPTLRYIHTLRHGVDMAFSANQQQLLIWGRELGVEPPTREQDLPRASLEFWGEANRRALELGARLGPERFLSLHFEDLCEHPERELRRIAVFLGCELDSAQLPRLCSIPRRPDSVGRHRQRDLGQFRARDLEAVRELGFEVGP